MAFPLTLSALTSEERAILASQLNIVPRSPHAADAAKSSGGGRHRRGIPSDPPRPFNFFKIDVENDELRIPIHIARKLFGAEECGDNSGGQWQRFSSPLYQTAAVGIDEKLRPHQKIILEEAHSFISNEGAAILHVPPGTGKTIMAIAIAIQLGFKFAVLVPRETLVGQWVETIRKLLGGDDDVSATVYIPQQQSIELRKRKRTETRSPSSSWQAIIALGDRVLGLTKEMKTEVGTLIVDEAHLCCVPSWVDVLLAFAPRYVIALTATLERPDGTHVMMTHLAGGPYCKVVRHSERPFLLIGCRITDAIVAEETNQITQLLDYTKFVESLSNCEAFNNSIVSIIQASTPQRKFIVLFRRVDHAERVSAMLSAAGIDVGLLCGAKRRSYVDCQVLCGSYGKISTGFDAATTAIDFDGVNPDTLILVNGAKQDTLFEQTVGRVMRADPGKIPAVIVLLTPNRVTQRHFDGLRKRATEMKAIIRKISSSSREVGGAVVSVVTAGRIEIAPHPPPPPVSSPTPLSFSPPPPSS